MNLPVDMNEPSGPDLDRRKFLAALVGATGTFLGRGRHVASVPQVTARATVFYSIDGRNALVRFTVEGSTAPAGRLRVFDVARRQIGTAGVVGFGGRLYGELWLPLDRDTTVHTELELPGTRGVLRSVHRLTPARRWTIYWTTIADNPITQLDSPEFVDHAALLRVVRPTPASFAVDDIGLIDRLATAPMILAGSGLRLVGVRNPSAPLARIESRDGSVVFAVGLASGASPRELGLAAGRGEMERRVEQWLAGPGGDLADASGAVALIAATDAADSPMIEERAQEWNARYSFPRIVTGKLDELLATLDKRVFPVATRRRLAQDDRWRPVPREGAAAVTRVFEPLVSHLGGSGLDSIASQFAFLAPGTLVLNATPFTRTGLVVMPDGSERVVTDVPATGYACLQGSYAPARWEAVSGGDNDLTLDNSSLRVRIDPETGAIRSLVTVASEYEWIRRGAGFNTARRFRVDTLQKARHADIGMRVTVTRRREASVLRSTLTVYDGMPWLDITNELTGGEEPAEYGFATALDRAVTAWEIPGGFDEAAGSVPRLVHLRWLKLGAGSNTFYFRGIDAPVAGVSAEGEVTSRAPATSRYRLGFASGHSMPDDPWRFGWSAEPLTSVPVPGTGRATLPSFGSMFSIDQPAACILDIRQDRSSRDVTLVLQELAGWARDITLGAGVLSFNSARKTDLAGRDLGTAAALRAGRVTVPIRGFGLAAVRLSGVELARA